MDNRALVLEITKNNDIVRIARGRQSAIAKLSEDNKTLTWKDANLQAVYRTSVESFLTAEGITVVTTLMEGQKPDILPEDAPEAPKQHKMQGELTPDYLEWMMKWKPIAFQNLLGVIVADLKPGEKVPDDPRKLWMRADVIRSDTRPNPASQGGQYITTRFKMKTQIIARRATHLTFTTKEIYRGDTAEEQAEPYKDPHHPETLHKMDKRGEVEIVHVKNAAASSGSNF
jgi:hypothetical protein